MGWTFHGHKRDVDAEKHLKRLHKTIPFIESPLVGADHEHLVFHQRHEANSVELFFDLFLVANLATFTAYHAITDIDYLLAYIGFFGILWSCWFQITLHDVRFARDSIYERVCKTVQFIAFVGLALVGSHFNPANTKGKGNNTNFRILCYTLVISRGLLAFQYLVVFYFTWKAKYGRIYLPIILMVVIYAVGTAAFAAMTPAFRTEKDHSRRLVYVVWYIVMVLEAIAVIAISCIWRMMSFKKTHLMERMSLLTMIVIGEGAIGVTKTVSRMMGKHGLEVEGCFLIMCIITLLVLIWALYFDNFPHGHYGTIRQQIWSLLHFPFQLAIVGVVEGSQQIALARYVAKNTRKVTTSILQYCQDEHLDGKKLQNKLQYLLEYFELDKKFETTDFHHMAQLAIWNAGNATNICSPQNTTQYNMSEDDEDGSWPGVLKNVSLILNNAVYTGLGMKIPVDKLEEYRPLQGGLQGFELVYLYYWTSFCMLLICLIIFLFLIRRHKADLFDFTSVISRALTLSVGGAMLALMTNQTRLHAVIGSPAILPICVVVLFLILVVDKLSSIYCNWQLQKSGEPYALEYEEHGHHGHGQSRNGSVHETGALHGHIPHDVGLEEMRKPVPWSARSEDMRPLTSQSTEYNSRPQSYAMESLASLPLPSPPTSSHDPPASQEYVGHTPGGCAPVSPRPDYGA